MAEVIKTLSLLQEFFLTDIIWLIEWVNFFFFLHLLFSSSSFTPSSSLLQLPKTRRLTIDCTRDCWWSALAVQRAALRSGWAPEKQHLSRRRSGVSRSCVSQGLRPKVCVPGSYWASDWWGVLRTHTDVHSSLHLVHRQRQSGEPWWLTEHSRFMVSSTKNVREQCPL